MTPIIFKILGLACITILWVHSEPTNTFRELLGLEDSQAPGLRGFFTRMFKCCLCSGFNIGLLFTFDIEMAAIIAVVAELLSNKLLSGK